MKKITLVLAMMLIGLTSATASGGTSDLNGKDLGITKRYRYAQPIKFVERGVEFLVFPNGEFDFNTSNSYSPFGNYRQKWNSRRGSINVTFGAPGSRIGYTRNKGVRITHDRFGRVRSIGNVFLNYDYFGRIKRIGSVYMKYHHGKLKQVGGLHIQYGRWGRMIGIQGFVNHSNAGCGFCGATGCTADHFGNDQNDWYQDDEWYGDENDDMYYYRKDNRKQNRKRKNF